MPIRNIADRKPRFSSPADPQIRRLNSRGLVIAVSVLVFLAAFFGISGPSWQLALYRLVEEGGSAFAWLLAAAGIGWVILLPLLRPSIAPAAKASDATTSPITADAAGWLWLVTACALGIGAISLATLVLGLLGWLNAYVAWGMVVIGGLIAATFLDRAKDQILIGAWMKKSAGVAWLWVLVMPIAAMTLIGDFLPPGLLWPDEPHWYDVVEYHLQVPREWYEAHRIVPLTHNVFSYMPFNVEMHYLLAMHLRGGPWAGMYLAQVMHAAMWLLTIVAVYALAGGGPRATLAAILAAAVPWVLMLGSVAYDEGGEVLFGLLAIGWAMRAQDLRQSILAGALAGFAVGCKWPIAPLLILGVPLVKILIDRPLRAWLGRSMIYVLSAVVVLLPWLIRNAIWAGNPFFPELMSLFGRAHFSAGQEKRWQLAYLPEAKYRSLAGHLGALWHQVLAEPRFGWVILIVGAMAALLSVRQRRSQLLIALLIFQTLIWLFFTHVEGRFMVICIPLLALLAAEIQRRNWAAVMVLAVCAAIAIDLDFNMPRLWRYVEQDHQLAEQSHAGVGLLGRENLEGLTLFPWWQMKGNASLDLVGDAAAFDYQIPMTRLNYKTVFDVDTSDPKKSIIEDWLAGMPTDALMWADRPELVRFARTYYGIPLPPPEPRLQTAAQAEAPRASSRP